MLLRKKFRWIVGAAVIFLIGVVYYVRGKTDAASYVTAAVTRGSIVRTVVATGTVNPVTTVQVGSYVSGPIQAIYADFNSPVKTGQLIAKIDPRPYQLTADQAAASLANAQAQLAKDTAAMNYNRVTYERNQKLLEASAVSPDTVDSTRSAYLQSKAQVALDHAMIQQQRAVFNAAKVNLGYTNIVSPVDGTVVSRNVDVGQTVAASFQTPTLFLIARDLTQMQVDTNVSESDIGNVKNGERAEFHVDAFPDRTFVGIVSQVRQAPITVQNVVTYDVVVSVANPEFLLKPGMTADVTIITARRDDVVRVPVAALRFSPAGLASTSPDETAAVDSSGSTASADENPSRVWIRHQARLEPVPIRAGLSDGVNTEVLDGGLKVGQRVVTDEVRPLAARGSYSAPISSAPHFR